MRALSGPVSTGESGTVTNLRQHTALKECCAALTQAAAAARSQVPHEMLLLDLYTALGALDALTGATSQEEILALIFGKFCIGK